jgi:thiol-disulfide isomerase/thioredoxin
MKSIFIAVSLSFALPQMLFSQTFNQVITDTTIQKEVLIGYCDRQGLMGSVFGTYYQQEYALYEPDPEILLQIGAELNDYSITIVMGSWCDDSQEQVPRFFKIIDALNYDEKKITLIGVDRKKNPRFVDIQSLAIELVPTFIFYKDNAEAGRIVETPVETIESDVAGIIIEH